VLSGIGIGSIAGSVSGALLAAYASHMLQLTHSYASLFAIVVGASFMVLLAPGLKKVELAI
jgi:hypothetical protein